MKRYLLYILLCVLFFTACDATKRVPEGSYLLNKAVIESDAGTVSKRQLKRYLRQQPNASVPVLGRVRLHLHNIPNNDSSLPNRLMLKYGQTPVLYSEPLTVISAEQLRLHLNNKGYLNARVDTSVVKQNKKANVTYKVKANDPYRILTYRDTIHSADTTIYNILNDAKRLEVLKEGDIFDMEELEKGRLSMMRELRNNGYYNFTKDNFYFLADTTVGTHQVALTLALQNPTDSTLHPQYNIGHVTVINGVDMRILEDSTKRHMLDTVTYRGMRIVSEKEYFLRPKAIYYNTFLRPGRLYSDRIVERTYSSLNNLGPISQTGINLQPALRNDSNFLDTRIVVTPGNLHYTQFGVDGTHSAGDLGIATNLTYEHRNLLKGGERLRIRLNGAYEYITANTDSTNLLDKNFYEYGAEVFLSIPQLLLPWLLQRLKDRPSASTEFSVGVNFQKRPEYLRQFFNLSSRFQWSAMDWRLTNVLEPVGITYVRMPWSSDEFKRLYLSDANPILRYSYEDQFIVRTAFTSTYSNSTFRETPRYPFRVRAGVEVAGWIPRIVTALGGSRKNNQTGFQEILSTPYSEYVKGDFDFAITHPFDDRNTIAAHLALGVGYPYGNSLVLPFEKRYFGGGANSVRGWSTRTLGPGTYRSETMGYDFAGKVGDIKLDMSVEYRRKLTGLFEIATFVDAGNIWTINNYEAQPGGYFQFGSFYKEIALSYGTGVRLDLDFLLLRVDFGMKAHNPGLEEGQRWTIFRPELRRDFAFHFAIGYPF